MKFEKLNRMFNPKTVGVIGASNQEGSVGHSLMKNMLGSGFNGTIYPINPKHPNIHGVKTYPSVSKVPDRLDLAIIATPAKTVPGIVEECGKNHVAGIEIISAGFSEAGKEGTLMSEQILKIAREYGMRVLGPNCLGFIKPSLKLNASFANKMALPGNVAFISQSGALCTAILDWSVKNHVGFSHFVSIGSMLDIGFHDLIDYFGSDPHTKSILIYMESLTNARKFLSAARAFSRTKPILVLKVGKSAEGAHAALSHTGSLTGNDSVFDAAFKRAGIVRVNTIGELFGSAETLSKQKRPNGKRLAIVTNAGGPGVIATDSLIARGGELAKLSDHTISELNKVLPPAWSKGNPIDVLGDAQSDRYKAAVALCSLDPNVDGILVILTPQSMTKPDEVAEEIVSIKPDKTILASWMGADDVALGHEILVKGGIPVFMIPENAIRSFMSMYNYSRNLELLYETPATIPHAFTPQTEKNRKLIEAVVKDNRFVMTENESKMLLSNYEIPTATNAVAHSPEDAVRIAADLGYPVVMKILSPDIIHKTDVGGVQVNIKSGDEARQAYSEILHSSKSHNPEAIIHGIFVEKMEKKRYEILIGCKKDPIFGPAIVFGMGGVAVEVFKDTNVGLPPLNMALAMRLIEETKIYKLLKGYRGMKGVDVASIQFLLYKFAYLISDFPEILEIDINPFAVDEEGGIVLDAKVILDKAVVGKQIKPYSHLVISPYPKEYMTDFTLKDGRNIILRPIRPEDEPLEREMFTNFSEQTQRYRFFQLIKDITHGMLIRYTQIDYDREIAIIAEIEEEGKKKMAGVVRLIGDAYGESAEFAIVVADPWQNQGLGNKFTDHILDIAKKRGTGKIYANVLKDNVRMLHIFEERGFKVTEHAETFYCELEL